jgi:hypothetical protein
VPPSDDARDGLYRELLLTALRECRRYRPAFGGEARAPVSLEQFKTLYGRDPLYHWVGLDSDRMYAAHKAAGGMTSIYRQLGIGCERLVRQVIQDSFALTQDEVAWAYEYETENGLKTVLTLDARIDLRHVRDAAVRRRTRGWLRRAGAALGLPRERTAALCGVVFEVRQGYKSADSKRQNADLRFGIRSYNQNYLPVLAIVSTQVSAPVCRRYRAAQLLVLLGCTGGNDTESTFAFFTSVVGYDLSAFFARNSATLRAEFTQIVDELLRP